jgi:hypothetical protein
MDLDTHSEKTNSGDFIVNTATHPTSHRLWRAAGVAGLLAIAAIHAVDIPDKLSETPYIGWMYIGLVLASLATATALTSTKHHRPAWVAAAGLAASTFVGYCLSRTTGLPNATYDIGNWGEPLGVISLIVEASVVLLAATLLRSKNNEPASSLRVAQQ